jgi:magnesium transporter
LFKFEIVITFMSEQETERVEAWEALSSLLEAGATEELSILVKSLSPGELARGLAQLEGGTQARLLEALPVEECAWLIEQLPHAQAGGLFELLPPSRAAAILDRVRSDEQADILAALPEDLAEAILGQMAPEEAADARRLGRYGPETAGGLMITEYLAFPEEMNAGELLSELRAHAREYARYDVQYVYVTGANDRLRGVIRIRDLVLSPGDARLSSIMIPDPVRVQVNQTLEQLEHFFGKHYFYAVPVVDLEGRLVGVVRRSMVEEALGDRSSKALLRFGGIIGGEELRTMSFRSRTLRRLAFLLPNILLSFVAVTIIAYYEPLIEQVAALAIFLPLVANLSGAAGNQSVAVSIRELALGLVQPRDYIRVCGKEISIGFCNGLVIGLVLAGIAMLMRPELMGLAIIVGSAYWVNSIFSVMIGGTIPLIAKGFEADPAMISSPILTTVTDMGSFFLTLSLAAVFLLPMVER